MAKVPVQGMTLSMLADGYAGKAIDVGLKRIMEDIVDRGHDRQKRVMTIKITFTPDQTGQCKIGVDVGTKCPSYVPPETVAKYDQQAGGLMFSPDSATNPDQMRFPEMTADDAE